MINRVTSRDVGHPGRLGWERWLAAWHGVFLATLVVVTLAALADSSRARGNGALLIAAALVFAGWYWGFARRPSRWRRPRPMLLYFAGATALWLILTTLHPAFFLLSFVLFPQIYAMLPLPWAIPVGLALSFGIVWQQSVHAGTPLTLGWTTLGLPITTAVFNTLLTLWIAVIIRQSEARQRLIDQLEAARRERAEAEHAAGVLAERQRLAREIHDTLAQGFTSIVMHLEAAEQALPPEAPVAQRHLDQARRTARESLAEARRFVWALRPELLERATVGDSLRELVARWSEETGVKATARVTGTILPLTPEQELTLLRVAQEALANIHKHAAASYVTLTLSYMDDTVILDVQDDGVGFAESDGLAASTSGGFGLRGLRERVEAIDGSLLIESAPGEGTTVVVELAVGARRGAVLPGNLTGASV